MTMREGVTLDKYFAEISKIELLTPDEEVALAKRVALNDHAAVEHLTRHNLRFVVYIAKEFQGKGLPLEDLISEGNQGLILAVKKFDPTKGVRFISFAVWWVKQFLFKALGEQTRTVKLPLSQIAAISKIKKIRSNLEQLYEREPTNEEIAESTGLESRQVARLLNLDSGTSVSIEEKINAGNTTIFLDVLAEQNSNMEIYLEDECMKDVLPEKFRRLSAMEKEVTRLFYGLKTDQAKSLEEIAAKSNLSKERIRQIRDQALRKLRAAKK